MSLEERLEKIRSPKLQNQRETAIVLAAVEDTLKDEKHNQSPTAYFVALLALLGQATAPPNGSINKDLATSVVYLLDLVTSHVPPPLLRSKFPQILTSLAPALTNQHAEAPLLRSSIGCLESLLVVQDAAAWAQPQTQISPRRAVAGLLALASDDRPKVRKRAQEAITVILKHPPPSPSLDHPVADMCAETALKTAGEALALSKEKKRKRKDQMQEQHDPGLLHTLHLVKTIATAPGGWPSKKIEPLCEFLMQVSRSNNEYLTMGAFEVFEVMFAGMADHFSSSKLPRLLEAISELQPSENDSQLLPAWLAVISRGYDVSGQISPEDTFFKLPALFSTVAQYMSSASHNIRVSASECLISFLVNCIPDSVITEASVLDEKVLEKLTQTAVNLLTVRYQGAWMEVFNVEAALFEALKWRAYPLARDVIKTIGELRASGSFNGKKEADAVLGKAILAVGPEAVLEILPLNLAKAQKGQAGRAWLLPLLRDNVVNTDLMHFESEFVPLSEAMYQRVIDHGDADKTVEVKIFETIVHQTWALFPGYCNLPLDLAVAFDQKFAELLSNLLYSQPDLRSHICRGLQRLVESNQEIQGVEATDLEIRLRSRMTKNDAQANLDHLTQLAGNLLAVLFNVYSQTLPQHRGYILQCINAYLSIAPEKELLETFSRVTDMLEASLNETPEQQANEKQSNKEPQASQMPPTSHTLMDLVITLSIYLPLPSFPRLLTLTSRTLPMNQDPQLQKKAYKLIPRLESSANGSLALKNRSQDLQTLLLSSAPTASAPARRDRLEAIATTVNHLPQSDLHFIPSILSEVVIATKEVNEKARSAAFELLILMSRKMSEGGTIEQSKIPHMDVNAPTVPASLEEFCTMVSAGLVGSTPHMVSASITALTRILYEFHSDLQKSVVEDFISTIDLFLTSNNREIVRSCLGFTKVAVTALDKEIVQPRLQSLVPALLGWSKEHKSRFRAKVKHIFERMVRRFGVTEVERWCPEEGKALISNIRKTKERNKRKKSEAAAAAADDDDVEDQEKRRGRFESEYDEAIYGSEDDGTDSAASSDNEIPVDKSMSRRANGKKGGKGTYIIEDSEEPLDLLDRNALSRISTSKPVQFKARTKQKAQTDVDGKLIFGSTKGAEDDNAMIMDDEPGDETTLEGGINAYVEAIKGRDAVQRGRGGRLKFSNKRQKGEDRMDIDGEDEDDGRRKKDEAVVPRKGGQRGGSREMRKKFDPKSQRRGLGVGKVRGGRVAKVGGRR
ncbi:MAG: hypothetical protein Q9174_001154 [Haloplaca sp. 1 TL-2023]